MFMILKRENNLKLINQLTEPKIKISIFGDIY